MVTTAVACVVTPGMNAEALLADQRGFKTEPSTTAAAAAVFHVETQLRCNAIVMCVVQTYIHSRKYF